MIGIFIIARLGSTRLQQKHLIECNGKTFIEWLIERINKEFEKEIFSNKAQVFIVTSNEEINRTFEKIAKKTNTSVFYGNVNNIPLRQYECAIDNKIDTIISVDGDDILCSTEAMKKVAINSSINNEAIIKTSGLPLGMNIMGYSIDVLKLAVESVKNTQQLDTGWGGIFEKFPSLTYQYFFEEHKEIENLRMTLDYEADSEFFKAIIEKMGNEIHTVSDKKLIKTIIHNNFSLINNHLNEEYFINFNSQKKEQQNNI